MSDENCGKLDVQVFKRFQNIFDMNFNIGMVAGVRGQSMSTQIRNEATIAFRHEHIDLRLPHLSTRAGAMNENHIGVISLIEIYMTCGRDV